MSLQMVGKKIWIRGIVQGVGFRPFVYTQAVNLDLTGWVRNTSSGVELEINGTPDKITAFIRTLENNPPPLSRIDELSIEDCQPNGYAGFEIIASQPQPGEFIPISPDMTICENCQIELFTKTDPRYRYPFINCTNCGPRYTIIKDIPYDRPNTTMAAFPMCERCKNEYDNPLNRRFHAQPVACPDCGPHIWFETSDQAQLAKHENALQLARDWIRQGKILAIKGLGGFHLACDATNTSAVTELRRRKKRSDKPFALMAFDLTNIEKHCIVTPEERVLLSSKERPIVLLERRNGSTIVLETAPGQNTLGFMIAYTPLHLLLMEPAPGYPEALVMTSGNISEEPIAYTDGDARSRLRDLADGFLMHNRPIHIRVDDSVTRVLHNKTQILRRARGYAPNPLTLSTLLPPILATGAELKNTFCLTKEKYAFLSHHIGDLENFETLLSFEEGIEHYQRLFRVKPQLIAADLHPDYLATRYAEHRADQEGIPLIQVQHHHAHLAACLADNNWGSDEPVLGLCFDGTGLGTDGAIWGGEFLLGNYQGYTRKYHLAYTPLPGGDLAVRKPARMALAHLWQAGLEWESDLPAVGALCYEERTSLHAQLEHQINSPLTSSMGRLFDAVSALLGIRSSINYEGQAAIELESLAATDETTCYEFDIQEYQIDPAPLWQSLISDWRKGVSISVLSARFHNSVAALTLQICRKIHQETGCSHVALSGGVWQNRYLFENVIKKLEKENFIVLTHHRIPTNDGGIALGQALIAANYSINR